jgi:hypothetical protein
VDRMVVDYGWATDQFGIAAPFVSPAFVSPPK